MKFRIHIYNLLVNRIPVIQKEYHKIRLEKTGMSGRIYAWLMLLWMNLCWICGDRKLEKQLYYPDINKKAKTKEAESEIIKKETPEELAERLSKEDIISFDIFDTLIFRPVCAPTDLFFFVGEKLKFMDFERIRREMEFKARQKAYKRNGSYEVTLEGIYEELETWTGIPKEMGMEVEIETELEFCFANPYLLKVYQLLKERIVGTNKKIICVSDMYLPKAVLRRMVEKCGYTDLDAMFVSCEYGKSKADGSLYRLVMETYGTDKKYIHVGDNPESDGKQAKKRGWESIHFSNVNIVGMPYRAEDLSLITGSLYRGIVNSKLYSGVVSYDTDYELGYIYGGIFVLGYCQFIHQYAKNHSIDKLMFLSRDGDVIKKVYEYLYPEEKSKCEYVYWSRTVATKLMAKWDRYDYLRRFVDHKVNQKITLEEVYQSMGLEDILEDDAKVILTDKNAKEIKERLIVKWPDVLEHYEELSKAGKLYYRNVLKGSKKALAVDVGWAGSGAIALEQIVNREWNLECDIIGIIAGSNSVHNAEPNATESFLYSGKLVSFLYSQEHNRECWKWHNPGKNHNLLVELLLSSKEGSLKDMVLDDSVKEGYSFVFKKPDVAEYKVEQIQQGILDFAKDYVAYVPDWIRDCHVISGSDAYAVLKILLRSEMNTDMEIGI